MNFEQTNVMDLFESCFCMSKRTISDACVEGDLGYVKKLLKNRDDVNKEAKKGEYHIFSAVRSGKVPMARYLLAIGASPSVFTSNNWGILHEAVGSGSLQMVEYILKKCSRLHTYTKTKDGISPLHLAVFNGYVDILKALLKVTPYAYVSPRGAGGITPLMTATKRGERQMMKDLHMSGASFFEADDYGKNTISMAKESGVLEVVYDLNICLMDEHTSLPKSRPIFIDTIQSRRNERKKVFFGVE